MLEQDVSIAFIRLRLTETANREILQKLAMRESSDSFMVGLCGSSRITGKEGVEVLVCVNTLAAEMNSIHSVSSDTLDSWIKDNQKDCGAWPVFFHKRGEDITRLDVLIQGLQSKGYEKILDVEILADNSLTGSLVKNGKYFPINKIVIPGSDILIWTFGDEDPRNQDSEQTKRFEQTFGSKTRRIMAGLKIGIVGVSGTGSPVAEMLYRLGVGSLVLVDDDRVEIKNLGRIFNSSRQHAQENRYKVDVLEEAFISNGLPTEVKSINTTTRNPSTVLELAQCDVIFGCMDSESGRSLLNRLCAFYLVPYFDLGVNLKADGIGGLSVIYGAVHYLKPDGSSLLTRKCITTETIESDDLKRTNPELYSQRVKEKYIKGVDEERPAVITVNTMTASFALNDFLARIHPYRNNPNSEIECIRINLREPEIHLEPESEQDQNLFKVAGRGDIKPLLGMMAFSKVSS